MPTEILNKIISVLSHTWDAMGLFQTVIVQTIPVVAWLVRKPLANLVFKLFNAIGKGVGFKSGDKLKESAM